MIYAILGITALTAYELPGLIKRRDIKEITVVALIILAVAYYLLCYLFSLPKWSPFTALMNWMENDLGLSYEKLLAIN